MALLAGTNLRAAVLRGVLVSGFSTLLLIQGALRWRWLTLLVLLVCWAALAPIGACVSVLVSRLPSGAGVSWFKRFAVMLSAGVVVATLFAWAEAFGFHLLDPVIAPDPLGMALPPGMIIGALVAYLEFRFQGIRRTEAGTQPESEPEERASG